MGNERIEGIEASAAPSLLAGTAPVTNRVRAYFAPVTRSAGTLAVPIVWDPSTLAAFNVAAPPLPWVDLGWCGSFKRKSGTHVQPLVAGAPGVAGTQVRTLIEATVSVEFESWGKLQLALSAGVQQMNVLPVQSGATANGSGGTASGTVPLTTSGGALSGATTALSLDVGPGAAATFAAGQLVVVDVDYIGQTGFVGSGASGGFVKSSAAIGSDLDYVRRVSLNVARVVSISGGVLELGAGLLAGTPQLGMQVSPVVAFCDREGGSFFQEWSALFLIDGAQGDRVAFHYPRLQAMAGAFETTEALGSVASGLERLRLAAAFRALPIRDANDGESIVCFRSYLPAAWRSV